MLAQEIELGYKNGKSIAVLSSESGLSKYKIRKILLDSGTTLRKSKSRGLKLKEGALPTLKKDLAEREAKSEEKEPELQISLQNFTDYFSTNKKGQKIAINAADLYKVYVGYILFEKHEKDFLPISVFLNKMRSEVNLRFPDFFLHNLFDLKDIKLITYWTKGQTYLDIYKKNFNKNSLISSLDKDRFSEIEIDLTLAAVGDMSHTDFNKKYGAITGFLDKGETEKVNAEKTAEELADAVEAAILSGLTTSENGWCKVEKEEKISSTKQTVFKSMGQDKKIDKNELSPHLSKRELKKLKRQENNKKKEDSSKNPDSILSKFKEVNFNDIAVFAELCSERHSISDIVGRELPAIFKTVTDNQRFNFGWMESEANCWLKKNIRFENSIPTQSLVIYTTGLNALNYAVFKCCARLRIPLIAAHYNKESGDYEFQDCRFDNTQSNPLVNLFLYTNQEKVWFDNSESIGHIYRIRMSRGHDVQEYFTYNSKSLLPCIKELTAKVNVSCKIEISEIVGIRNEKVIYSSEFNSVLFE